MTTKAWLVGRGRASRRRGAAFQDYLERQTPERRAELLAAESQYLESSGAAAEGRGVIRPEEAAERDFEESMHGYEEKPTGGLVYVKI